MGVQKSPDWDGDVDSWTESEGTSSSEECAYNAESLALNVVGQDQSGEKISLSWRIGDLEGWPRAATSPWICCARKCIKKERDVVTENKGKKECELQDLLSLSGPI